MPISTVDSISPHAIDWLADGQTLITPTKQLAQYISNCYAKTQIAAGNTTWPKADCLPWSAFVKRLWQQLAANQPRYQLLNITQRQYIWAEIIRKSQLTDTVVYLQTTIDAAIYAYKISRLWSIPIFPSNVPTNKDAQLFAQWVNSYQAKLQQQYWLDPDGLPEHLLTLLAASPSGLPARECALYGFDELRPQEQELCEALAAHGLGMRMLSNTPCTVHPERRVYIDSDAELSACAQWAREILNHAPESRIGVVLLDNTLPRERIQSAFQLVFSPAPWLVPADALPYYGIAHGRALATYPIINAALTCLQLAIGQFSFATCSRLLRCQFIGGFTTEATERALLEAKLRDQGSICYSVSSLLRIWQQLVPPACNNFEHKLQDLLQQQHAWPKRQGIKQWLQVFSDCLQRFSWPGDRSVNSEEYQTIQAWQAVIEEVISLDNMSTQMSAHTALQILSEASYARDFQPQTGIPPVQILGTKGAAAMQFEHLWLLGAHADAWPTPHIPVPFIPLALQRHMQLPQSSAEHALHAAQQITNNLLCASPDVIVSYPHRYDDKTLRPSPLLYHPNDKLTISVAPKSYLDTVYKARQLEHIPDDMGLALDTSQAIYGGTHFFKAQAACPFQGFARYRLAATSLSTVEFGLNAMIRGTLLHKAMHYLWQICASSTGLSNITYPELEHIADKVLAAQRMQRVLAGLPRAFVAMEKQRLLGHMQHWLEVEKARPLDFSVYALEKTAQISVYGLTMRIQIDRIDQLPDKRYVVIDYKSGSASCRDWHGERPKEPQLPLYAVTSKLPVVAVAFANLKLGAAAFSGYAESTDILPDVGCPKDLSWQAQLESWQNVLARLAAEIKVGDARVLPRDANSCRYCNLHGFCRIRQT